MTRTISTAVVDGPHVAELFARIDARVRRRELRARRRMLVVQLRYMHERLVMIELRRWGWRMHPRALVSFTGLPMRRVLEACERLRASGALELVGEAWGLPGGVR